QAGRLAFVAPHELPVRHALTQGELARLLCAERKLACRLEVVAVEGWRRDMAFVDTGLPWRAPSPALPSAEAALLYPGVGLLELTNVSVGRGTERPFALVGAPWIDGPALVAALGPVPGVRLEATRFTPRGAGALIHHAGQACSGIALAVTDPRALRPVRLGLALAAALVRLHGPRFEVERVDVLLRHAPTLALLRQGASPDALAASWAPELEAFEARRAPFLLY
ncbi:MAG: DUF1343 domain-containing protein, partial [Polyangiaceae bacterium]|nr:DUF1343 domain-containing protein [Polyangiaceae bacterium]